MEIIRGKLVSFTDTLSEQYTTIHVDLGTGDGRFVQHMAQRHTNRLVVGIDACRENLVEVSRRAPANAGFVIANALALPPELQATHITINFPWGSLLDGLLTPEPRLLAGLRGLGRASANLEVRLNGGALAEAGYTLDAGTERVRQVLLAEGFKLQPTQMLTAQDLKHFPTTWAKRLAFGRDPRATVVSAIQP